MENIIEVKNLGKKYNISERQGYVALRDVLANIAKSPARWFGGKVKTALGQTEANEFWALSDVNFEVNQGEVMGIIGRNGAGKSTLLKILSQITPPTTGEIKLRGRVGSLLEVGTGFHPELTGRENIYLNGAILGMRKYEIEKKFDEIVDFAGITKFLDMPVKRYSSGMYVRLAFAVAAHLEPEILVVDEVLAVGDVEFQKKCLGKMEEVTQKNGRTVLFVSHNLSAVDRLCKKCIYLDKGRVKMIGETKEVINSYLADCSIFGNTSIGERKDRRGSGKIKILDVYFTDEVGNRINFLSAGKNIFICCNYEVIDKNIKNFNFGFSIDTLPDQNRIAYIGNKMTNQVVIADSGFLKIRLNKLPLNVGKYQFAVICTDSAVEIYDWIQNAGQFEVEADYFYNTGKLPPISDGFLLLDYSFE